MVGLAEVMEMTVFVSVLRDLWVIIVNKNVSLWICIPEKDCSPSLNVYENIPTKEVFFYLTRHTYNMYMYTESL